MTRARTQRAQQRSQRDSGPPATHAGPRTRSESARRSNGVSVVLRSAFIMPTQGARVVPREWRDVLGVRASRTPCRIDPRAETTRRRSALLLAAGVPLELAIEGLAADLQD